MKILIAEDTEDSRILLEDELRVHGYEVESAANGAEALEKAKKSPPDLIISDILMPEMDGYALCRKLKKIGELKGIPFIFYSATFVEQKDEELALSLGASRFVIKPMEFPEFLKVIEEVLMEYERGSLPVYEEPKLPAEDLEMLHSQRLGQKLDKKVRELAQEHEVLTRREAQLHEAQRIANIGHWEWNILTNAIRWSDQIYRIFGQNQETFQPTYQNFLKCIHPDDRADVTEAVNSSLEQNTSYEIEHRVVRPDGDIRFVHERGEIFRDETGEPTSMIGTVHDITERKHAEDENARMLRELLQAHKMEALGQLTAGIAHDFNNILGIVMGNTELAITHIAHNEDEKALENLKRVEKAGMRAKSLVLQMLTFSRSETSKQKPEQLQYLIEEDLKMLRSTLPSSIEIKTEFQENLPDVMIDSTHLNQVLMNLCLNAKDAMRGKGSITIGLCWNRNMNHLCTACHKHVIGDWIELSLTDTGSGIKSEVLDHIFDPFFTTKEVGEGTGLGMSVIHRIVSNHGGHILVDTELGKGTNFRLLFPPLDDATLTNSDKADKTTKLPKGAGEHVMIVDDEPALADYLGDLMEMYNYQVSIFTSSKEALESFKENPDGFDLLITDQTMPEVTGIELVMHMRDLKPGLPVILNSGFSEEVDMGSAEKLNIRFLEKPVSSDNLIQTVKELFNSSE